MKLLLLLLATISWMMLFSNSPLLFCLSLVLSSFIVSLLVGVINSSWLMASLLLIFMGGMMVIFIYMTTLSGSEKLFFSKSLKPLFNLGNLFLLMFFSFSMALLLNNKAPFSSFNSLSGSMYHLYLMVNSPVVLFLTFYLLTLMVLVVKSSQSFKGALTKFN